MQVWTQLAWEHSCPKPICRRGESASDDQARRRETAHEVSPKGAHPSCSTYSLSQTKVRGESLDPVRRDEVSAVLCSRTADTHLRQSTTSA